MPVKAKSDTACSSLSVISNCFSRWKRMKRAFFSSPTRQSWIMISSGLELISRMFAMLSPSHRSRRTLSFACTEYLPSHCSTSIDMRWFMITTLTRSRTLFILHSSSLFLYSLSSNFHSLPLTSSAETKAAAFELNCTPATLEGTLKLTEKHQTWRLRELPPHTTRRCGGIITHMCGRRQCDTMSEWMWFLSRNCDCIIYSVIRLSAIFFLVASVIAHSSTSFGKWLRRQWKKLKQLSTSLRNWYF